MMCAEVLRVSVLKVMLLGELVVSIDGDSCLPWWIGLANSDKVIIDSVGRGGHTVVLNRYTEIILCVVDWIL